MKVRHLEVRNFRGFEHQIFNFSDQFNVLIGDNGTGKTAILEALALGINGLIPAISEDFSGIFSHNENNFRQIRYEKGKTPTVEYIFPLELIYQGVIEEEEYLWTYSVKQEFSALEWRINHEIREVSQRLRTKVSYGSDALLPVIAYYPTGRLWKSGKSTQQIPLETLPPGSRLRGYQDCLNSASDTNQFLRWFKTFEIASLQRQESIGVFEAVKVAIENCLRGIVQRITFDILEDDLLIKTKDECTLPLRLLSDGARNMVAMIADIAYRSAVLNPQLEEEVVKNTPGIVLIDEIDLHLHPKWQRRVIEDLRHTFPKIQFIATTHSPFIVQSLRAGELINLDSQEGSYYNKSIEDITEQVMGVDLPQQSERWKKMMQVAEEYYQVLRESQDVDPLEIEHLKTKLDELTLPFSDDPAYQAFLKMEREAAGLGKEKRYEAN